GGGSGQLAKLSHSEVQSPEAVLAACEAHGIAYLPFFPLAVGALGKPQPALAAAAEKYRATPAQIAIAWLLGRSKVMLPIPGTSSPEHLQENWDARKIALTSAEITAIAADARRLVRAGRGGLGTPGRRRGARPRTATRERPGARERRR